MDFSSLTLNVGPTLFMKPATFALTAGGSPNSRTISASVRGLGGVDILKGLLATVHIEYGTRGPPSTNFFELVEATRSSRFPSAHTRHAVLASPKAAAGLLRFVRICLLKRVRAMDEFIMHVVLTFSQAFLHCQGK